MSNTPPKPVLVICGTTGVGKSQLAIELAHALQAAKSSRSPAAKVINADSMQVYEGLDVITNKVTVNEQQGVEHLLMSFKKPGEQYVVGEWVRDATSAIDKMHAMGQIPIVVGGTSYWIHHLLFQNSLPAARALSSQDTHRHPTSDTLASRLLSLPDELRQLFNDLPHDTPSAKVDADQAFALHALLNKLDPEMGARWHWRDTRKVLRNLEIMKEKGCTATEAVLSAATVSGKDYLRYNALIFWLYARPEVLNPRLDERVDVMLQKGLLDEIKSLRALKEQDTLSSTPDTDPTRSSSPTAEDFTLGVYQAIGYKEFDNYLSLSSSSPTSPQEVEKAFADGLEDTKKSTKKYAQRQIKWIRNKTLPAVEAAKDKGNGIGNREDAVVYLLDATDIGPSWKTNVLDKAVGLTKAFLDGSSLPKPTSLSNTAQQVLTILDKPIDPADVLATRRKLVCPVCTIDPARPVMLEHGKEWEAHQRTRAHRRLVKKAERGPEWEEWVRKKKEEREAKVRGEASNVGNPAGDSDA